MGIIYILENKINGKHYIGQTTKSFKERFRQHQQSHSYIGNSLRKHSVKDFSKLLLENVPDEELDYWEIHYIQECNSVSPNGYNLTYGGEGGKHCEETRNKMSKSHKGEKNHFFGQHHTKKSREKMSEAQKGNKSHLGCHHTIEVKKRMSEMHKGKIPWMKGKLHTEEAKRKNSESNKGKIPWNKGKIEIYTEETRRKMGEKNRGKHLSIKTEFKKGQIPWNKSIRIPHLCPICENSVKEKYDLKGEFKGYRKTCGDLICIRKMSIDGRKGKIAWNKGKKFV